MLNAAPARLPAIDQLVDGRFRLLTQHGEDAAGALFDALDEVTAEVVRLRIPVGPVDSRLLGVQHPQLARQHGVTPQSGFIVTEDIDGEALCLGREGSALQRVHEVAAQLLPLFATLHSHGVVHGHLGLHSVWRDREGHLRVVDLGLPSRLDAGSRPWASPERRRGEGNDARGDVYSLASLLYGVATGEPPQTSALQPAAPTCAALPAPVAHVLWQAMDPRQAFRYDDAAAFWEALEPVLSEAVDAEGPSFPEPVPVTESAPLVPEEEPTLDGAPSLAPPPPRRQVPTKNSWASMAMAAALLVSSVGVASVLFAGLGLFVWTQT